MRALWHISDLHFTTSSSGVRLKDMTKFNKPAAEWRAHGFDYVPDWTNWDNKILADWSKNVGEDDIVLVGGDNAWPKEAYVPSMRIVGSQPGDVYTIDGNHCKYVHKGIGMFGRDKFAKQFKEQTNVTYIGGDFVCIGDTGILGVKLCDLPSNTFYTRFKQGFFENERFHLRNLVTKYKDEMLQCKNRIVLAHYPLVDDKLDYENSDWLHELMELNPTHCLYGHYHGPEVKDHLPELEQEWNGIKFLNTSLDLHNFKMRKVLDDVG